MSDHHQPQQQQQQEQYKKREEQSLLREAATPIASESPPSNLHHKWEHLHFNWKRAVTPETPDRKPPSSNDNSITQTDNDTLSPLSTTSTMRSAHDIASMDESDSSYWKPYGSFTSPSRGARTSRLEAYTSLPVYDRLYRQANIPPSSPNRPRNNMTDKQQQQKKQQQKQQQPTKPKRVSKIPAPVLKFSGSGGPPLPRTAQRPAKQAPTKKKKPWLSPSRTSFLSKTNNPFSKKKGARISPNRTTWSPNKNLTATTTTPRPDTYTAGIVTPSSLSPAVVVSPPKTPNRSSTGTSSNSRKKSTPNDNQKVWKSPYTPTASALRYNQSRASSASSPASGSMNTTTTAPWTPPYTKAPSPSQQQQQQQKQPPWMPTGRSSVLSNNTTASLSPFAPSSVVPGLSPDNNKPLTTYQIRKLASQKLKERKQQMTQQKEQEEQEHHSKIGSTPLTTHSKGDEESQKQHDQKPSDQQQPPRSQSKPNVGSSAFVKQNQKHSTPVSRVTAIPDNKPLTTYQIRKLASQKLKERKVAEAAAAAAQATLEEQEQQAQVQQLLQSERTINQSPPPVVSTKGGSPIPEFNPDSPTKQRLSHPLDTASARQDLTPPPSTDGTKTALNHDDTAKQHTSPGTKRSSPTRPSRSLDLPTLEHKIIISPKQSKEKAKEETGGGGSTHTAESHSNSYSSASSSNPIVEAIQAARSNNNDNPMVMLQSASLAIKRFQATARLQRWWRGTLVRKRRSATMLQTKQQTKTETNHTDEHNQFENDNDDDDDDDDKWETLEPTTKQEDNDDGNWEPLDRFEPRSPPRPSASAKEPLSPVSPATAAGAKRTVQSAYRESHASAEQKHEFVHLFRQEHDKYVHEKTKAAHGTATDNSVTNQPIHKKQPSLEEKWRATQPMYQRHNAARRIQQWFQERKQLQSKQRIRASRTIMKAWRQYRQRHELLEEKRRAAEILQLCWWRDLSHQENKRIQSATAESQHRFSKIPSEIQHFVRKTRENLENEQKGSQMLQLCWWRSLTEAEQERVARVPKVTDYSKIPAQVKNFVVSTRDQRTKNAQAAILLQRRWRAYLAGKVESVQPLEASKETKQSVGSAGKPVLEKPASAGEVRETLPVADDNSAESEATEPTQHKMAATITAKFSETSPMAQQTLTGPMEKSPELKTPTGNSEKMDTAASPKPFNAAHTQDQKTPMEGIGGALRGVQNLAKSVKASAEPQNKKSSQSPRKLAKMGTAVVDTKPTKKVEQGTGEKELQKAASKESAGKTLADIKGSTELLTTSTRAAKKQTIANAVVAKPQKTAPSPSSSIDIHGIYRQAFRVRKAELLKQRKRRVKAARTIQQWWTMSSLVRRYVGRRRMASITLQTVYRGYRYYMVYYLLQCKVIMVQRWWRLCRTGKVHQIFQKKPSARKVCKVSMSALDSAPVESASGSTEVPYVVQQIRFCVSVSVLVAVVFFLFLFVALVYVDGIISVKHDGF